MSRIADVLIQAGHEGRTSGATGASGPIANERDWTDDIADEATRLLRFANYTVIREDATTEATTVKIAAAIHFDGSAPPCRSGTSFGYPTGNPAGSNRPAVDILRAAYLPHVPAFVKRMPDNFTAGLRGYYGYRYWTTSVAEFVWEVCEISCRQQAEWAQPRLQWFGQILAHAIDRALGNSRIPHPGAYSPPVVEHLPAFAADAIRKAQATGVMVGDSRGWRPNDPLTRAEAAVILNRIGALDG